jgi:acetylornithine deacetylase/succinyl-diaminopimelate desuccinylase-like protein
MLPLLAALAHAGPAPATTPARVAAVREKVDWNATGEEVAQLLAGYLQVDTTNPPGNEARGVEWLGGVLDREGIAWERVDHGEGRASLIARLPGSGAAPPVCLLSHIDVVTADAAGWTHAPLGGERIGGEVWGRGALDMKGMGIVELETVLLLHRLQVPLARDVVLLAVADEEIDGVGMQSLVQEHWDRIGCTFLLNEGGLALDGALFEGQVVHAISVAEKGIAWIRMNADGTPGHGSVPDPPVEAPSRLLAAMARIDARYDPKPHVDPVMRELLRDAGRERGGLVRPILGSRVLTGLLVKPRLMKDANTRAAITTTVHLTGMTGANQPNVVPSRVSALYDCRLLPGVKPDDMLAILARLTRRIPGISFELLDGFESNRSPIDDPFYAAIAHYAVEGREGHVAAPLLSVGFTDSLYARPLGVHAYGYVPFVVTGDEADTMHGDDERVSEENLREGTRRVFSIIVDFAGAN